MGGGGTGRGGGGMPYTLLKVGVGGTGRGWEPLKASHFTAKQLGVNVSEWSSGQ